jgi:hypothetical protein
VKNSHRFSTVQATRLECFVVPNLNIGISFSLHHPRQNRSVVGIEALANESVRSMLSSKTMCRVVDSGTVICYILAYVFSYGSLKRRDAVEMKNMAMCGKSRVRQRGLQRTDSTSINRSETGFATDPILKPQRVRRAWHDNVKHPASSNTHPKDV